MSKLLTLKAIAKELDVPESSLRKYREIFSDFIPSVGKGRSRRYKSEAIEVLREIRQLREDDHLPWESISDKLAVKYPIEMETETRQVDGRQVDMFSAPSVNGENSGQQPAAGSTFPADGAMLKKISALGERQAMMMNALALEMIKNMEDVAASSRRETRELKDNVTRALSDFASGLETAGRNDSRLLSDVKNQLSAIDDKLDGLKDSEKEENVRKLAELQTVLENVRGRLEEKENLVKDYQVSVETLKSENEKLKESRRSLEDKLREKNRQGAGIPSQQQARSASSAPSSHSSSSNKEPQPSFLARIFGKK